MNPRCLNFKCQNPCLPAGRQMSNECLKEMTKVTKLPKVPKIGNVLGVQNFLYNFSHFRAF